MNLTNKLNLPEAVVNAIVAANEEYSRGNSAISVSELLNPPRIIALRRRHQSAIVEDVADLVYSLIGTTIHDKLEAASTVGITEERLFTDVNGWRISGKFDHFHLADGRLTDYKMVTGWKVRDGQPNADFEAQLNVYAELLELNGYTVKSLCNVCFIRDWSKRQAAREPTFPQQQVIVIDAPLWSRERRQAFLAARVALHQAAQSEGATLPLCTPGERWAKRPAYAIKKKNRKRAIKLFDDRGAAASWVAAQMDNGDMYIEDRPAENIRCALYCNVSPFCDFAAALPAQSNSEELSL